MTKEEIEIALSKLDKTIQRDVLIVDDNLHICELLKDYCQSLNLFKNIVFAHEGIIATQKLRNQKFSLVLLDLNLPKKSGLELLTEFDDNSINFIESVLIVSGTIDKESMTETLKFGVKNYLIKPFDELSFMEKAVKVLTTKPVKKVVKKSM